MAVPAIPAKSQRLKLIRADNACQAAFILQVAHPNYLQMQLPHQLRQLAIFTANRRASSRVMSVQHPGCPFSAQTRSRMMAKPSRPPVCSFDAKEERRCRPIGLAA